MQIGVVGENQTGETRVAMAPDTAKKLIKRGFEVSIEKGAGNQAGYSDKNFEDAGVRVVDSRSGILSSDIVFSVLRPAASDISQMKADALLICSMDPFTAGEAVSCLAAQKVNAVGVELFPRISRAQSMDVLSSQANIAGYRAVLEAAARYKRFFPMMMTSAGMSKPAKAVVLGVGVAGLQAIATLKRLGASVEAFDIRPEVKEQIQSLGAKAIEIDFGEDGAGQGGYARQLSSEGQKKILDTLTEKIKTVDIVISTASIPGRKSPTLVSEEAVRGMREGSVIVDMAAAGGGNCPLTKAGEVIEENAVIIVGLTNYPALMPADASAFYANNLVNFLEIVTEKKESGVALKYDLEDEIVAASLMTYQGTERFKAKE